MNTLLAFFIAAAIAAFPFSTKGPLSRETTASEARRCPNGEQVLELAVRGEPPAQEWVVFIANDRFVAGHFPKGGDELTTIYFGVISDERLLVRRTQAVNPDSDVQPCDWLFPATS